MANDKTTQTQSAEVSHIDRAHKDRATMLTVPVVTLGGKTKAKTSTDTKTKTVTIVPMPTDLEPYLNEAKEVWLVCRGLKGNQRFRLDDPIIDSLLTDHLYRVGYPRESIKALRHRLAAVAYKKADLVKDPLDDTLTTALHALAQQRAKSSWTIGAFELEDSAYLQGIRLNLDTSTWPRKNWFSKAVKDRIEDLRQVYVKVTAEPRGNLGQYYTFTLLPKPEGDDASDAISSENEPPVSELDGSDPVLERPAPDTLLNEQGWKQLHEILPRFCQGPRFNVLLIGSPEVSQKVVAELLRSVVCETAPSSFGCGVCHGCSYFGVLDRFTDTQVSEEVQYCYLSGEKLSEDIVSLSTQWSEVSASRLQQIIYLEGIDNVSNKKAIDELLRYITENGRVSWIVSAERVRDIDERLLAHFPLDMHLEQ